MCLRRLSTYIIAKGGQSEQRWMDLGGTLKKWSLEEDMMGAIILALFPSAPCNGMALRGCARLCPISLLKHPLTSLQGCEPKVVTWRFDKDLPVCSYWAGFFCCHFIWEFSLSTSLKETQRKKDLLLLKTLHFLTCIYCLCSICPDSLFQGKYL